MSFSEKIGFCPSENICFSKRSEISRQYLAKNAFVPAPNMIFTLYLKEAVQNQVFIKEI